ncbi:MAG: amino acid permease, partial [Actinomycetota bacterium]
LVLAANTAYQDFPRLASILARDRFLPGQFVNRGDRLVFSNGVIALALLASLLIYVYDAEVTRLIQLYVVGVFTSFTLSQAGMVMRWRRRREEGWRSKAALNTVGAVTTGVVLIVVTISKFLLGAWLVVLAAGLLVLAFRAVHRHYESVAAQLRIPDQRPQTAAGTHIVIPVARIDEATLRAVGYAKSVRPLSLRAVHVPTEGPATAAQLVALWDEWQMSFPLEILEGEDLNDALRGFCRALGRSPNEFLTVLLPERLKSRSWVQFLRRRRGLMLKAAMLFERQVVVTDVPVIETEHRRPLGHRPPAPRRNEALVLVSNVHNASLRAVAYALGLRPSGTRAVTFALDETDTERITDEWSRQPFDVALEILDSPFREVRRPLVRLVREIRAEAPGTVVTVVLPEFVVRRWWHQFLHNQTALAIKARLLFEPDVVVTSVPFHLS